MWVLVTKLGASVRAAGALTMELLLQPEMGHFCVGARDGLRSLGLHSRCCRC